MGEVETVTDDEKYFNFHLHIFTPGCIAALYLFGLHNQEIFVLSREAIVAPTLLPAKSYSSEDVAINIRQRVMRIKAL